MGTKIKIESTGIVYRNPKPYLHSQVAYHPSLILRDEELIVTFDIGQAVESLDYHTVLSRSKDEGRTWNLEGPLLTSPAKGHTHSIRTSRLSDGSLVGFGAQFNREDPEAGLINRKTFGFVPTDLFIVRSPDDGHMWTSPEFILPPLDSPAWEICHPIVELRNGRWLAPTSTWRGWDGQSPAGEQTLALISDDRGASWPSYGRIFDGRVTGRTHFEVSVVELADGRVLAVGWVHDTKTSKTFPSEYCLSQDSAQSFCQPKLTGFEAQTCKLLPLHDGRRILCVYRRNDRAGLWASLAEVDGEQWNNLADALLWDGAESGMTGSGSSADKLSSLKFGYPSLKQFGSGDIFVIFWCQEECLTNIRWIRLAISD